MNCQVGPTRGGGLGYGLVCGDYLKFLGERTGLCGGGGDREVVLPIRGPLGVALRSGRMASCCQGRKNNVMNLFWNLISRPGRSQGLLYKHLCH